MALTADVSRKFGISEGPHSYEPVKGSTTIYQGSAVGDDGSGYARALVAGDPFRGFAWANATNTSATDGAIDVEVRKTGEVTLAVTGVTGVADIDDAVYASADGTFTKTATSNSAIGKIVRWIASTTCVVYFEGVSRRSI